MIRASLSNEAVLLDSAFDHLERIGVIENRLTPVERLVDRALSSLRLGTVGLARANSKRVC